LSAIKTLANTLANVIVNLYLNQLVAAEYDHFYKTGQGKAIDNLEKAIMLELIDDIPRGQLLELGCGTGHWTEFFSRQRFQVIAIDESEAMLSIAQNKKIKNVTFIKANAAKLPFADNSFFAVASITMLEFVENSEKVLDEIDRVLRPGGHIILGCLNALSELGKNKQNDEVFKHARFFTPAEIEGLLSWFGTPILNFGIFYSPMFELLDGTEKQNTVQPAFIAAKVQKTT
jgi:ubiquinone/menaquinone biosynthesis C-methylase UbiE